jgi:8-oxo-dGTP pyrophosphatase MutT (NUDIX family)
LIFLSFLPKVHIHEAHAPRNHSHNDNNNSSSSNQSFPSSSSSPAAATPSRALFPQINQLYNFSLVICRHPLTGKFLLCQEFANQGFWCPGGAVDSGEVLTIAAKRETIEEAGIDIELKGILAIEYNPVGVSQRTHNYIVRLRVIFYAEPSMELGMNQLPKSCPDYESAGACWCSYEEIQNSIKLRGSEPKKWTK